MALACLLAGCAARTPLREPGSQTREDIISHALSLLGKPYRLGAKGPDAFDCSGLVFFVFKRAGIKVPVTVAEQDRAGLEITLGEVRPGDLILFRVNGANHVGIMLTKKEFIHSSRSKGVCIDSAEQGYWKRGFVGFRRFI